MRNAAAANHGENTAKTVWQIHVTNWETTMAFLSQKSALF